MGKQPELNITDWENKLPVIFDRKKIKMSQSNSCSSAIRKNKTKKNKKKEQPQFVEVGVLNYVIFKVQTPERLRT